MHYDMEEFHENQRSATKTKNDKSKTIGDDQREVYYQNLSYMIQKSPVLQRIGKAR